MVMNDVKPLEKRGRTLGEQKRVSNPINIDALQNLKRRNCPNKV